MLLEISGVASAVMLLIVLPNEMALNTVLRHFSSGR
jgi:hypothetical protein